MSSRPATPPALIHVLMPWLMLLLPMVSPSPARAEAPSQPSARAMKNEAPAGGAAAPAMPEDAVLRAVATAETPQLVEQALQMVRSAPAEVLRHRDDEGRSAVHHAAAVAARLPLLQALARRGADLRQADGRGSTPCAEAAGGNNLEGLRWLAQQGAATMGTDADGETPLHRAAREPRAAMLQWLLAQGADLQARDHRGRRALDIAVGTLRFARRPPQERLELARLLGGGEADVARGWLADQPLLRAIHQRDLPAVTRLLREGADPDVPDEWGHAPLHYALTGASTLPNTPDERAYARRLLPLLLRHGADPSRVHDAWNGTTYIDDARRLRVLDLLEREMRAADMAVARRP